MFDDRIFQWLGLCVELQGNVCIYGRIISGPKTTTNYMLFLWFWLKFAAKMYAIKMQ